MEITTLIAAVAAFGLPCSNPELRDYPAEQMPWPAAYVRSIEGQNIIALRDGIRNDTQRLRRILVHELLHCGLYEDRERRGQPQLLSLDPREELAVQVMTDVVLQRLNRSVRDHPRYQDLRFGFANAGLRPNGQWGGPVSVRPPTYSGFDVAHSNQ